MNKVIDKFLSAFAIIILLSACNSGPETDVTEMRTKKITIFDTEFTIPADWCTETDENGNTFIFMESNKPEKIYEFIYVQTLKNSLSGTTYWDHAVEYYSKYNTGLPGYFFQNGTYVEKRIDKPETPVFYYSGVTGTSGDRLDMYCLFANTTDPMIITYNHNDKTEDRSAVVRSVVDNMKLSFSGFDKSDPNKQVSSSSNNKSDSYKEKAKAVYRWCQDRFKYYDEREGYDTGDKFDNEVFEDAASHFGLSRNEAKKMYDDGGMYIVRNE